MWITVKQFCDENPVWSEWLVRKSLNAGELPGIRLGRKWFMNTEDLKNFFSKKRSEHAKDDKR